MNEAIESKMIPMGFGTAPAPLYTGYEQTLSIKRLSARLNLGSASDSFLLLYFRYFV
jgi:hypothetical protein